MGRSRFYCLVEGLLKRFVGWLNFPVNDDEGNIIIGVGRNLDLKGLSDIEIEFLMREDIKEAIGELDTHLGLTYWDLDTVRKACLIFLQYKYPAIIKSPKLKEALDRKDYKLARKVIEGSGLLSEEEEEAVRAMLIQALIPKNLEEVC